MEAFCCVILGADPPDGPPRRFGGDRQGGCLPRLRRREPGSNCSSMAAPRRSEGALPSAVAWRLTASICVWIRTCAGVVRLVVSTDARCVSVTLFHAIVVPAMTFHVAHTCRKSCQRKFLMPARLSAFLQALVSACPSGLPLNVNTRSGCQAPRGIETSEFPPDEGDCAHASSASQCRFRQYFAVFIFSVILRTSHNSSEVPARCSLLGMVVARRRWSFTEESAYGPRNARKQSARAGRS